MTTPLHAFTVATMRIVTRVASSKPAASTTARKHAAPVTLRRGHAPVCATSMPSRKHEASTTARLALALACVSLCGCECAPPPPSADAPVAQLSAVLLQDGGFELVLSSLQRPVRSLQVDVKLEGALATSVVALGGTDLVEAGLGAPKDDFTLVVTDTRRLNLPAGAVARISAGVELSTVTLSRALAVDDSGALRDVTVLP